MAKWVAISGTWRHLVAGVEKDVREAVQRLHQQGTNLVVGSAPGVDSFALDEMLMLNPDASRILVMLPTTLPYYVERLTAWGQSQSTLEQEHVKTQIALLERLLRLRPEALQQGPEIEAHKMEETDYSAMNARIVAHADELQAFQVDESHGTQDAIDKARSLGKRVVVHSYHTL